MGPAGMQMMMGGAGDDGDPAALIGHGFLLDGDVFTTIDHPDAVAETAALGINNRGRIVGAYADAEERGHAFVRDKGRGARRDEGVFTTIDFPGAGGATVAQAINDRGQIVGFYNPSAGTASKRGFLLDDGEFTTIDHPDATFEINGAGTSLFGLNDHGQIVGQYSDSSCHGFLLDGDTFTTIDNPDALFATGAADIDDRRQIVGFYDGMTGSG